MFCKKKYRCVGRLSQTKDLFAILRAFLRATVVKMFQPIQFRE